MTVAESLKCECMRRAKNNQPSLQYAIIGASRYYKWLSYKYDILPCDHLDSNMYKYARINLEKFFSDKWFDADIEYIEYFIKTVPLSKIIFSKTTVDEWNLAMNKIRDLNLTFSYCPIEIKIEDVLDNLSVHFDEYIDLEDYLSMSPVDAIIREVTINFELIDGYYEEQVYLAEQTEELRKNSRRGSLPSLELQISLNGKNGRL